MGLTKQKGDLSKMTPLTEDEVRHIIAANRKGVKPATMIKDNGNEERPIDCVSSLRDESIDRFDNKRRKKKKKKKPARNGEAGNPGNTGSSTDKTNNRKPGRQ